MSRYMKAGRLAKAMANVLRRLLSLFGLALKKDLEYAKAMESFESHLGSIFVEMCTAKDKRIDLLDKKCALLSDDIKQANDAVIEARRENAKLEERCEALVWLVEVQDYYMWLSQGNKTSNVDGAFELFIIHRAAIAATEARK